MKFNPGETLTWLREEWQDLIEEGRAEIKGEYALIIKKTPKGIRVVHGPGKGKNWRGRKLNSCPCKHHQRLFRVLDTKDLCYTKKYHSIMKVTWRGPRPDWGDVRHHMSNCISWLYMEKPSYHKNKRSAEKPPSMK